MQTFLHIDTDTEFLGRTQHNPYIAAVYTIKQLLAFFVVVVIVDDCDLFCRNPCGLQLEFYILENIESPVAALVGIAEYSHRTPVFLCLLQIFYDFGDGVVQFTARIIRQVRINQAHVDRCPFSKSEHHQRDMRIFPFFFAAHFIIPFQCGTYAFHYAFQRGCLFQQQIGRLPAFQYRCSHTLAQIRNFFRQDGMRDLFPNRQQFRDIGKAGKAVRYFELAAGIEFGGFFDIAEIIDERIETI